MTWDNGVIKAPVYSCVGSSLQTCTWPRGQMGMKFSPHSDGQAPHALLSMKFISPRRGASYCICAKVPIALEQPWVGECLKGRWPFKRSMWVTIYHFHYCYFSVLPITGIAWLIVLESTYYIACYQPSKHLLMERIRKKSSFWNQCNRKAIVHFFLFLL